MTTQDELTGSTLRQTQIQTTQHRPTCLGRHYDRHRDRPHDNTGRADWVDTTTDTETDYKTTQAELTGSHYDRHRD